MRMPPRPATRVGDVHVITEAKWPHGVDPNTYRFRRDAAEFRTWCRMAGNPVVSPYIQFGGSA